MAKSILKSGREMTKEQAEKAAKEAFDALKAKEKNPEAPDYEETEHGSWRWEIRG